jgi:hypothetical protein
MHGTAERTRQSLATFGGLEHEQSRPTEMRGDRHKAVDISARLALALEGPHDA